MKYFKVVFAYLILVSLIVPAPAYAYIDPGTGSQMLQILLAFLIAIPFAIKTFWGRIKTFFSHSK